MKKIRKVTNATVAMPVLQCNRFVDSENEILFDDPYDVADPTVSWSLGQGNECRAPQSAIAALPIPKRCIIITGATIAQIVISAKSVLENKRHIPLVIGIDVLFIELCASEDSYLNKHLHFWICRYTYYREITFH